MKKLILLILLILFFFTSIWSDSLKRRGFLGTGLKEVDSGILIVDVLKGSSAEKAGLLKKDIIIQMNKRPVKNIKKFLKNLSKKISGENIVLNIKRGKKNFKKKVKLFARPKETSNNFDIIYSDIKIGKFKHRTIITKPRENKKHPAVFFIQGYDCNSIDYSLRKKHPYKKLIYDLTQNGYVVMRMEKSGVGDSEGPAANTIGFKKEVGHFKAGLKNLLSKKYVDKNKVFIFGHSMGGVIGPIISKGLSIKGICIMGTTAKSWVEYNIINTRRQLELRNIDPVEIDKYMKFYLNFYSDFLIKKEIPSNLIKKYPKYKNMFNGNIYMGRDYTFWQELSDINILENWANLKCSVLSIWGESDFVVDSKDHKIIAEIINKNHKGKGIFLALPKTDHSMATVNSLKDSINKRTISYYNDKLSKEIINWMNRIEEK